MMSNVPPIWRRSRRPSMPASGPSAFGRLEVVERDHRAHVHPIRRSPRPRCCRPTAAAARRARCRSTTRARPAAGSRTPARCAGLTTRCVRRARAAASSLTGSHVGPRGHRRRACGTLSRTSEISGSQRSRTRYAATATMHSTKRQPILRRHPNITFLAREGARQPRTRIPGSARAQLATHQVYRLHR